MEDRLVGDGDNSRCPNTLFSELKRLGVAGSRPCQNNLGEELPSDALNGDDWNGDESTLGIIFCSVWLVVANDLGVPRDVLPLAWSG